MSYQEIITRLLRLDLPENKDFWKDRAEIPLLMKRRWEDYDTDKGVPLDETFALNLKKYFFGGTPLHMLIVGKSGRQKTRIVKDIVKGAYKLGYKILYIEPKEREMMNAKRIGQGVRLAFGDRNEKLPVVSYTPAAYKSYLEGLFTNRETGEIMKHKSLTDTKFYSLDIKRLDYREIWMSFGVPAKGSDIIVECINNRIYNLDKIKHKIYSSKAMPSTKNVSIQAIENLEGTGVFDKKYKSLPLREEWEKGNIVVINYHSRMGAYMNTDIGFLITLVKSISQSEQPITKKLIIFDDSFMYAGFASYNFAKADINYAQIEMANCGYNYRTFGMDTIIITQNLDNASILPTLVDGRNEFLITQTGNSEKLRELIPSRAYYLATNRNPAKGEVLYTNRKNYYFEWIYCNDDGDVQSGFPFDCTVGHS